MRNAPTPAQSASKGKSKGKGKGKGTVATVKVNKSSGQAYCKPYNDVRGCTNTVCNLRHRCDVQMPNGEACDAEDHNRDQHRGPVAYL